MRMSYQGLKLDDYLKYTGMTMQQLRDMYKDGAKKTVKIRLVLAEIIKTEKIEATDEEINAEIDKYAANYGAQGEEFKKNITDEQKNYFKEAAVMNKTLAFLKEKNPAKKAAKKTTKKADDGEEKPKKTAAKKTAEEKKPAAKKTAKKVDEE